MQVFSGFVKTDSCKIYLSVKHVSFDHDLIYEIKTNNINALYEFQRIVIVQSPVANTNKEMVHHTRPKKYMSPPY